MARTYKVECHHCDGNGMIWSVIDRETEDVGRVLCPSCEGDGYHIHENDEEAYSDAEADYRLMTIMQDDDGNYSGITPEGAPGHKP